MMRDCGSDWVRTRRVAFLQETALQAYIDSISELILHEKLRSKQNPGSHDGARAVARVRTLTVLPRLDRRRKGSVVQFLHEANLIDKDNSIVNLQGADLKGADLWGAMLGVANLTDANLKDTRIWEADLNSTNLRGANLHNATFNRSNLWRADLSNTNLAEAFFGGASLVGTNLNGAMGIIIEELEKETESLKGATMPDGSIHP